MRQGSNVRRGRGRPNRNRGNVPPRNQTFDSAGPEGRIRGNAHQVYEKYLGLARDATSSGDRVAAEAFYQFAEHYFRILNDSTDPRPNAPRNGEDHVQGDSGGEDQAARDTADRSAPQAGRNGEDRDERRTGRSDMGRSANGPTEAGGMATERSAPQQAPSGLGKDQDEDDRAGVERMFGNRQKQGAESGEEPQGDSGPRRRSKFGTNARRGPGRPRRVESQQSEQPDPEPEAESSGADGDENGSSKS